MFLLITSNVTKNSSYVPSSSNNVTLSSNNVPFSSNNVTLCSNNVPSSSNNGLVLGLCLYFVGLWLCTDFSQSWSCFFWAVVVFRLPSVLVLPFLGCGCAHASPRLAHIVMGCGFVQTFPSLDLAFAGLWLCIGFPWSLSCLCWAVVLLRLPPVFVLPMMGCGYARASQVIILPFLGCGCTQASPSFGLAFAGCGCALVSPGLLLAFAGAWL